MASKQVVSSVVYSDEVALQGIIDLYVSSGKFDLDPCYSVGNFYKNTSIPNPVMMYDVQPQMDFVGQADVRCLPIPDKSIQSVVFDPPFMFGTHGQTKNNIMNKRFTMFDTWGELCDVYKGGLSEFYRILRPGGIVAFKCQDYTDSTTTMTHCKVYEWATEMKFKAEDLFILISGHRIWNPNLVQRHARKFHSYWWVFKKGR